MGIFDAVWKKNISHWVDKSLLFGQGDTISDRIIIIMYLQQPSVNTIHDCIKFPRL